MVVDRYIFRNNQVTLPLCLTVINTTGVGVFIANVICFYWIPYLNAIVIPTHVLKKMKSLDSNATRLMISTPDWALWRGAERAVGIRWRTTRLARLGSAWLGSGREARPGPAQESSGSRRGARKIAALINAQR